VSVNEQGEEKRGGGREGGREGHTFLAIEGDLELAPHLVRRPKRELLEGVIVHLGEEGREGGKEGERGSM
jgi:hypothetical protein